MQKFTTLTSIAVPLAQKNVDTDAIIRIEHCTGTPKEALGPYAFEMARRDPGFVLNQPRYRGAQILVAGEFFGTGSSREMAVWALAGMGLRCVIAPSFGQIFYGNCLQNGLLPVVLPAPAVERLLAQAAAPDAAPFTVDLERQIVNGEHRFEIGARRKRMLLEGLDEIGLTLALEPKIAAFQSADRARRPWIYP